MALEPDTAETFARFPDGESPRSVVVRRMDTPVAPFPFDSSVSSWQSRENWPAQWIEVEGAGPNDGSSFTAYRLKFRCETKETFRIFVTADQRYWLYLDGERIGEGSERGTLSEWFYETYEITLEAGEHTLSSLTWWMDEYLPRAQITVRPAFLLASPDIGFTELLSTGLAPWEGRRVERASFLDTEEQLGQMCASGGRLYSNLKSWESQFQDCAGGWRKPRSIQPGNNGFVQYSSRYKWTLKPARLLPQRREKVSGVRVVLITPHGDKKKALCLKDNLTDEVGLWKSVLGCVGNASNCSIVVIPEDSERMVLIKFADYVCGYSRVCVSGGAGSTVDVSWAERTSTAPDLSVSPNDRKSIEGNYFVGMSDVFEPTGEDDSVFEPIWWTSGCWVRIIVKTTKNPLYLHSIKFTRAGYPLEDRASFRCEDSSLAALAPVAFRTLQSCAHETYMDCPYWEQLQYLGDTRLQALLTYATSGESELPKKAVSIFRHSSTGSSPLPASCFPANTLQIIAPFSLWWIEMLNDFATWRGDVKYVREHLPFGWWIIDHFLLQRREDGLVASSSGWNYLDSSFSGGEAPGSGLGEVTSTLQWQCVLALDTLAKLSDWTGQPERAAAAFRLAGELAAVAEKTFWDADRCAIAEDVGRTCFAEHSQALALISGRLSPGIHEKVGNALTTNSDLIRAKPYFTHYILEAYRRVGAEESLISRIEEWKVYLDLGFSTFPEHGVVGRSDCHAWNAHPYYHLLVSVLGVRPKGYGFESVVVEPLLGSLGWVEGSIPHPAGDIFVRVEQRNGAFSGSITLPRGLNGEFRWKGRTLLLDQGRNDFIV